MNKPRPVLALAWTHHALKRLGERVGSRSLKIQKAVEQDLVDDRFELIESYDDGTVRVNIETPAGPINFVLKPCDNTTLVITVLPSNTKWGCK